MAGSRRNHKCLSVCSGLICLLAVLVSGAAAQISPGELHESHAFLEGVDNCGNCHSPQGDQLPAKCLKCHTLIEEEQRTGNGLHARKEYAQCVICHVEHHGRDFALIYFEGGVEAFDHNLTGYTLTGKHGGVDCRKCHRPENIKSPAVRQDKNLDLSRTFLGLDRECGSCHTDRHLGQFSQSCDACHTVNGWVPATGFDHARSGYPLVGKHIEAACEKCHRKVPSPEPSTQATYTLYRPLDHNQCTACHRDPHGNRLGQACNDCHTPRSWGSVSTTSFDHDRTRYPLRGRHKAVACEKCHDNRASKTPRFDACRDCHRDYHNAAFKDRKQGGACEECHTVDGFRPALFSVESHQTTPFPLIGAHLAIPCQQCHRTESGGQKYTFNLHGCTTCHADPHRGQVDSLIAAGGCESCHTNRLWSDVHFDHSRTSFPLAGKHATAACRNCHSHANPPVATGLDFVGIATKCAGCHQDVHRNQFAKAESETDCARCHTPSAWADLKFDHVRDARFALDGAHQNVACGKCHPSATDSNGRFVRYISIPTRCQDCHGNKPMKPESES